LLRRIKYRLSLPALLLLKANSEQGSTVDLALNILVGSRLNSSERSVSGLDEAEPIDDENSILNKVNPIAPRLDFQLDMAVADLQRAQLNVIFKRLGKEVKAPTSNQDAASSWWELFLTVFLLMQNAQFVHKTQKEFPDYILASFYVSLISCGPTSNQVHMHCELTNS